ncbi:MAG TPA: YrdB family protein [Anaerolineales bacterium]|nr:YrdB family protein [Anaerolineales bacterium]
MSSHPINLGLRFLLEIAALVSLGVWGWQKGEGWVRFLLAVGKPVIAATLWATFRVPNDPGTAPIAIPGILRLIFELALFAFATWALYDSNLIALAWILGIVTLVHYISSYDRILWIIKQ